MKIGLFHESKLPPKGYGGIERIVVTLSEEYRRRGHDVTVFCRKGSVLPQCQIVEIPEGFNGDINPFLPPGLDFLHSHQPLKIRPKIPFVVTIHGNGHPEEQYFNNTNFLSQSHARNHNAKYFIYNGVDPTHYPFTEKKDDYFVFLARTTWRVKNVRTAIQWAQDLGLNLKIMGGSGISRGGIQYQGLVDEDAKLKLLAGARALIYPTNWDEPCAAAPLEALACGTPVITTPNGCMPELVRPGTGLVCSNYSELLDAADKISDIRPRACRDSVEGFFSLPRMTDDYLKLFEKIISATAAGGANVGDLDHSPRYNFSKSSVKLLYKPTLANRARMLFTGKV